MHPRRSDDVPSGRGERAPPRGDPPWWAPLAALAVFFGVMWLIPALMA